MLYHLDPQNSFFDLPLPQQLGVIIQNRDEAEPQIISIGAAETVNNSMPKDSKGTSKPDSKTRTIISCTVTPLLQFGRNAKKYVSKSISMHRCGLNSYESQTGWAATAFPRKLESHHKGSVDPQHVIGVSLRLPRGTIPTLHATCTTLYSRTGPANPRGSQRTPGKRDSFCGNNSTDGILLQPSSCPKKGWRTEASHYIKVLNQFVRTQHFKMEGIHTLKEIVRLNDCMVKVDLKDGFFTVPIHNSHKQYLRFRFQELDYQFNCLPFGLSSTL